MLFMALTGFVCMLVACRDAFLPALLGGFEVDRDDFVEVESDSFEPVLQTYEYAGTQEKKRASREDALYLIDKSDLFFDERTGEMYGLFNLAENGNTIVTDLNNRKFLRVKVSGWMQDNKEDYSKLKGEIPAYSDMEYYYFPMTTTIKKQEAEVQKIETPPQQVNTVQEVEQVEEAKEVQDYSNDLYVTKQTVMACGVWNRGEKGVKRNLTNTDVRTSIKNKIKSLGWSEERIDVISQGIEDRLTFNVVALREVGVRLDGIFDVYVLDNMGDWVLKGENK